jgi:hypothetical protein
MSHDHATDETPPSRPNVVANPIAVDPKGRQLLPRHHAVLGERQLAHILVEIRGSSHGGRLCRLRQHTVWVGPHSDPC